MNSTKDLRPRTLSFLSLILVAFLVMTFVPAATATDEAAKVIAHIPLPGTAVRQILLQQHDHKQYLYLQQRAHFTVVDVTDPKKPGIVERTEFHGNLQSLGHGLALTVAPDKDTTAQQPGTVPTQVVNVMDLSDPKHPRAIRTFNGVTSLLTDDSRKLIFIANNEGLWVLSHNQPYHMPLCTSEDVLTPNPDCQ
jgi:hypothetical protein